MIFEMRTYRVPPGNLGHRGTQRAKLAQDAEWGAFVPAMLPYLVHQESVFLSPAAFSPLK